MKDSASSALAPSETSASRALAVTALSWGSWAMERAAVCAAVAAGARRIRRAVVVTDSDPPGAPCGACRQVLAELGLDIEVTAVGPARRMQWRLRDLLPDAFTSEVLQ